MRSIFLTAMVLFPLLAIAEDHPQPPAKPTLPQTSLYVFDSKWTDQNGKVITWSQSTGTPRLVAFGYATCKGICPRVIADMQRIEKAAGPNSKIRFTFITLDPLNDLQPQLQALEKNHQLNAARWDLLRGSEDDLLELAVSFGIRYNRLPNGVDFAHSYMIALVGANGVMIRKLTDSAEGLEPIIAALPEISANPTEDRQLAR